MRLYLAGAMSQKAHQNWGFDDFDRYQAALESQGHVVLSPAQMDREHGFDGTGPLPPGWSLADCLRRDFAAIVTCDAVAVIPDHWEASVGVAKELRVADDCGIPVLDADTLEPLVRHPFVVGISGFARVGKDTAADWLVRNHGFTRVAFADALRSVLYDMDPLVRKFVDLFGWEEAKLAPRLRVRTKLQDLGKAVRDHVDPDAWIDAGFAKMRTGCRYVLSDVRYPNEAVAIRARDGVVLRIERPGIGPANDHDSEHALVDFDFDARILNDCTQEQLGRRVGAAVGLETT